MTDVMRRSTKLGVTHLIIASGLIVGLAGGAATPSWAGPNAGGRLLVHDTGLVYTSDSTSYPSAPPASCEAADVQAPVESSCVWKIYAFFPESSSPRLKALAFGEEFNPDLVAVLDAGLPSELDFEIPQDGWPTTPGGGVGISFGVTQTGTMVEVYWFGGYGALGGEFAPCSHPIQPSMFVDDSVPPLEDWIAGFRSMGFGVDGGPPCWTTAPGACCFLPTGVCEVLVETACAAAGGDFHGGDCDPNPCPPVPPGGACCLEDGSCLLQSQANCVAGGGEFYGGPCVPNPCDLPPDVGACCFPSGVCLVWPAPACASGGGLYLGGACDPNPCSPPPPESGETIATARTIPSLPFVDASFTCGFQNDYDEACPYSGSTSPDVVYRYVPGQEQEIWIDLCASLYDTKLYVYDGDEDHLVACSDDAGCGYDNWQSRINSLTVSPGRTYFVVIDGYGGSCGEYALSIDAYVPCVVECPAGAVPEGEPPCVEGYWDAYNGGCGGIGWTPIEATAGGCATLCGRSCTFLYGGVSYRDTDWFTVDALGGEFTFRCTAEFPLATALIWGIDCANIQYVWTTAGACQEALSTWNASAGQELWLWVAPSVYSDVPESDYVLEACGITGGVIPVEQTSWGRVKSRFLEEARREARGEGDPQSTGRSVTLEPRPEAPVDARVGASDRLADPRLSPKKPVKPAR